ncbi:metallophosphoesterase 1 [Alexandromys fortis]|uniref:metallophosphoesterase 1 n=1 Tax=Alexandromys fortis TaxID=100897 RepID=UPI0021520B8A|nr:metallophosphoesterase 1 [Microtus fortis]
MALLRWGLGRQNVHRSSRVLLLKLTVIVISVLLLCEYFIYYLVIVRCRWPEVKTLAHGDGQEPVLKAMFLADTHLLGEIRGHWLDKLRREWQMERAFQTALWLLQPEVVFILGDIFDEGKWSTPQAWADDVQRFQKMFRHGSHVQLKVVIGNHDIGFHYHHGCISASLSINSLPLLGCQLLWWLQPRLVLSGHTHSACEVLHPGGVLEVSVPSFSWRNRNNPSFIMGSLTSRDYALSKCYLPFEDRVLTTYGAVVSFLVLLVLAHFERLPSSLLSGWKRCRTHMRR